MLLADVTPEQILAFATPLAVIIAAVINQIAAWKAAEEVKKAANKVADVKSDLAVNQKANAAKLASIQSTGETTHSLVNNRMGVLLQDLANISRRLADATGNVADAIVAKAAEASSVDHDARQAKADAQ